MIAFMRRVVDAAWYKGPIHEPKLGGGYSAWRDALSDIFNYIRLDVIGIKYIRDPEKTQRLSDLEREYGLTANTALSESTRKKLLKPSRYRKKAAGSAQEMQRVLDNAGFELTVYNNSPVGPAIDPGIVIDKNYQMQASEGTNYYAGNTLAYAGNLGGEWLVNGSINKQVKGYTGAGLIYSGNTDAVAGYYNIYMQKLVNYDTPTSAASWPFCFFIGGAALFNPDGSILSIAQAFVPFEQKQRLENIILSAKPIYTWAGMIVTYT